MNSNEIVEILEKDFNMYYKTVLISGKWGVGKTYYVKKFLNNKKNSIYISLFGKNSIDDMKMDIYSDLSENNLKTKGMKLFKKIEGSQIGISFITITLPQMKLNIEKSINNMKDDNIIFVFDDLERKSDKISIEEILGFIEWLNQIDKVKIIIIANEEELKDEKYEKFKEKVIQKTYNLLNYSVTAPLSIMKYENFKDKLIKLINEEEYNNLISDFLKKHNLKNLRTLEKCVPFLRSILGKINFNYIKKEDLCEIIIASLSVVIESIDKLYEKESLKDEEQAEITYKIIREKGQELSSRIIKNYFNLPIFYNNKQWLINLLIDIFNDLNVNQKIQEIDIIYKRKNSTTENKKEDFYCSEAQIKERIIDFNENYIKKNNTNINFEDWLKLLNNYYSWAKLLKIESIFNERNVNRRINEYIANMDFIDDNAYTYLGKFYYKGNYIQEYMISLHSKIYELVALKYYSDLFYRIKNELSNDIYNVNLLKNIQYFYGNQELLDIKKLKNNIEKTLKEDNYFILDFEKELNDESWRWAHSIWSLVNGLNPNYQYIRNDFKRRINKIEKTCSSIIAKNRIITLNEQYPI